MNEDTPRPDQPSKTNDADAPRDAESGPEFERPAHVERDSDAEPFELEDSSDVGHEPARTSSAPERRKDEAPPEPCPNCGATMPDRYALVCLRCGYDQKTLRVQKTRIAKHAADADDEETDDEPEVSSLPPLCRPGRGDLWLPLTLAAIAVFALLVGHLAGAAALFPQTMINDAPDAGITVMNRLSQFARSMTLIALWTGCGLAGLFLLAQTVQRVFGDLTLAAARMAGIIATMRLATFIGFPSRTAEWFVECLVQGAVFIALATLLFALRPRDGLVLSGFSLLAWTVLWISAILITWVAG